MTRALLACCALALVLSACTEAESQCLAACSNSLEIALHQEAWGAGEYVLVARYDVHRVTHVYTCTFTLPGGADAACDNGQEQHGEGVALSVGATVALDLPDAPARIALELQPPEGVMKTLQLEPEYETYELCGSTCGSGSIAASFDDTGAP